MARQPAEETSEVVESYIVALKDGNELLVRQGERISSRDEAFRAACCLPAGHDHRDLANWRRENFHRRVAQSEGPDDIATYTYADPREG